MWASFSSILRGLWARIAFWTNFLLFLKFAIIISCVIILCTITLDGTFSWYNNLSIEILLGMSSKGYLSRMKIKLQILKWKLHVCFHNSGFEWDLNPQPLHYRCNALPTELSKPQESSCVWVWPFMFSGLKYMNSSSLSFYLNLNLTNSMVIDVQQ